MGQQELAEPLAMRWLVRAAAQTLAAAGIESAMLDAEILMAEAAGVARAQVLSDSVALSPRATARFGEYVARRAAREPLAYIVGRKEFLALDFAVTPAVLIPRPETETVVGAALEFLAGRPQALVLDLGTGSGAIAIAIAANAPAATIVATDVSKESLEVARRNAASLAHRIEFRHGDVWEALSSGAQIRFDLVISNPPYVEDGALKTLAPEISDFEPRLALAGGADGLDFYRRILTGVDDFSRPGGELLLEIGAGQAARVIRMCREAGCSAAVTIRDLAGIERVVRAVVGTLGRG